MTPAGRSVALYGGVARTDRADHGTRGTPRAVDHPDGFVAHRVELLAHVVKRVYPSRANTANAWSSTARTPSTIGGAWSPACCGKRPLEIVDDRKPLRHHPSSLVGPARVRSRGCSACAGCRGRPWPDVAGPPGRPPSTGRPRGAPGGFLAHRPRFPGRPGGDDSTPAAVVFGAPSRRSRKSDARALTAESADREVGIDDVVVLCR